MTLTDDEKTVDEKQEVVTNCDHLENLKYSSWEITKRF